MININNAEELFDREIFDNDGDKVGKVDNIYLDDATGKVKWLTVKTGLFGLKHAFVPVEAMEERNNGLVLPFDKSFIKDSPHLDADKRITPEEEAELYRYYQLTAHKEEYTDGLRNGEAEESSIGAVDNTDVDYGADEKAAEGNEPVATYDATSYDETVVEETPHQVDAVPTENTSVVDETVEDEVVVAEPAPLNTETDAETLPETVGDDVRDSDGLVLHEERVNVGTETVEAGEARLHKTVVTETQTVDVPVTHEEVHVVREPLDGDVVDDGGLGEDEVAVTLHEERPVIDKETVAVERVSLDTDTVTTTEGVAVEAAHEEVAVENLPRDGYKVEAGDQVEGDRKLDDEVK